MFGHVNGRDKNGAEHPPYWAAEMPHEIETFRVARARRHSMKDVYFLLTRFSPPLRDNGGDPAANEAAARNQGG